MLSCGGPSSAWMRRPSEVDDWKGRPDLDRAGSDGDLRVSDAERDDVVQILTRHHTEGRLDTEEFQDRVDATLRARTRAELAEQLTDLPRVTQSARRGRRTFAPLAAVVLVGFIAAMVLSGGRAFFGVWWIAVAFFVLARVRYGWWGGARRHRFARTAR